MNSDLGDEVYGIWINNWRKWKFAWCDSTEPVISFYVRFICKDYVYTNTEYGDFASYIESCIGKTNIDRNGILNINNHDVGNNNITIEIVKINDKYVDKFGIVTLKLSMFPRKKILIICKILEMMEYGVIYNGSITSHDYNVNFTPSKLPERDDPIWITI